MENFNDVKLCSGFGQFHSENHKSKPKPYVGISFNDVVTLAEAPQQVEKSDAQWALFSNLFSREKSRQEVEGQYCALWADIDEAESVSIYQVESIVHQIFAGCKCVIYSSRSATEQNQKCRIVIPLENLVRGEDYSHLQKIFNDKLEEQGIIPDRATERINQICYLPNRGEFYRSSVKVGSDFKCFDAMSFWFAELAAEVFQQRQHKQAIEERLKQSEINIAKRLESGQVSVIDAVNDEYPLPLMLETFGYEKKGSRYLSPNSQSGVAGVCISGDGRKWLSNHASDIGVGRDCSGGCVGDAFDLVVHYQYAGDRVKAIKEMGEQFRVGNISITKHNQRAYMQGQSNIGVEKDFVKLEDIDVMSVVELPPFPETLMDLPYQLGELQAYIFGRMTYPSVATAGITALATLTAFAQTNITIKSRDGLGFNEYYLIMAPTGFGKEDLRKPISILDKSSTGCLKDGVELIYSAPSSMQGLHSVLEENRSVMALSDEFAEWMAQMDKNSVKKAAMGYLMQIYTKALGTIHPGHAVSFKYKDVNNPRLSIIATSTAEAMFETMTREQAESGTHNRWVMYVGETELPQKRYEGLVYEPDDKLVEYIKWLKMQRGSEVSFTAQGYKKYKELDQKLAEPVKRKDGLLGGRLSEQAIKMAGLIALADKRFEISPADIEMGFDIRVGLYNRMNALVEAEGVMKNLHSTSAAKDQLEKLFGKKPHIYKSQLDKLSRKYEKLSVYERKLVIDALINEGICFQPVDNPKVLKSLVYDGGG